MRRWFATQANEDNRPMSHHQLKRAQLVAALARAGHLDRAGLLPVRHVMTADPIQITRETDVLSLVLLFHDKGFRHVLVTGDDGQLVGVISDRDVIRCFGHQRFPDEQALAIISAGEIMSTDLITVALGDTLETAVEAMLEHGVNCLPVVSSGKAAGILTTTDLQVVLQILLELKWQARPENSARVVSAGRHD